MNNTPTTTGAVAISSAMIASIISWLAGLFHISMPEQVAGAIAALILYAAHTISSGLSKNGAEKENRSSAG